MGEFRRDDATGITIRRYLSGTIVVRVLPPWFENIDKRQVKSPRVYLEGSGLLHTLLGIADQEELEGHSKVGACWEGFGTKDLRPPARERSVDGKPPHFQAQPPESGQDGIPQ